MHVAASADRRNGMLHRHTGRCAVLCFAGLLYRGCCSSDAALSAAVRGTGADGLCRLPKQGGTLSTCTRGALRMAPCRHHHGSQMFIPGIEVVPADLFATQKLLPQQGPGMPNGLLNSACPCAVLQDQYQGLSAQLSAAQERAACLAAVCTQLDRQIMPLLPQGASCNQWAATPQHVAAPPAQAAASPRAQSCMAALAQFLQQQQKQQVQQQRFQQEQSGAAVQQYSCCSPPRECIQPLQACEPLYPHQQSPTPWSQQGFSAAQIAPAACNQHSACVTPVKHTQYCSCDHAPAPPAACHDLRNSPICRQQTYANSRSPGPAAVAVGQQQPPSAAGLVSQLQAGVTRLQQQLGARQQQLMQRGHLAAALVSPQRSR